MVSVSQRTVSKHSVFCNIFHFNVNRYLHMNIFTLQLLFIVCVTADTDGMPTVHESWIYAMIVLGFIGFVALINIIIFAIYKTYHKLRKVRALHTKADLFKMMVNILLTFGIWIFNACACLEWAILRTDVFMELNPTKCIVIYISNYVFYMLGKLCLHFLLLYRLYLAFRGTALHVKSVLLRLFAVLISVDFIVCVSLWVDICLKKVTVGIVVPSETLTFCTLYNNSSAAQITWYQKTWPILFGAQDCIVGILTLIIFIYKLNQLHRHTKNNSVTEALVRKLFIMGCASIFSTFMLFTFAVPFYSNLTFLLPLDALINSLCVLLLLDWTNPMYLKVCCAMDLCLQSAFKHETSNRKNHYHLSLRNSNHKKDKMSRSAPNLKVGNMSPKTPPTPLTPPITPGRENMYTRTVKTGNLSPPTPLTRGLKDATSNSCTLITLGRDPFATHKQINTTSTDVGEQIKMASAGHMFNKAMNLD
eukprot:913599_1